MPSIAFWRAAMARQILWLFLSTLILFESLNGRTVNYEPAVAEALSIWTGKETV